jgi:hypothetical protein
LKLRGEISLAKIVTTATNKIPVDKAVTNKVKFILFCVIVNTKFSFYFKSQTVCLNTSSQHFTESVHMYKAKGGDGASLRHQGLKNELPHPQHAEHTRARTSK